jgi:hypothetical protein
MLLSEFANKALHSLEISYGKEVTSDLDRIRKVGHLVCAVCRDEHGLSRVLANCVWEDIIFLEETPEHMGRKIDILRMNGVARTCEAAFLDQKISESECRRGGENVPQRVPRLPVFALGGPEHDIHSVC